MRTALVNGRILTATGAATDQAVVVEGARIQAIVPMAAVPESAVRYDLGGGTLLPGFIDVQVNGGGGVLFNDSPTRETIAVMGHAHAQFGTTGFLPTIISADLRTIAKAIAAVDDAIASGVPGVLGIHVEGPFLSPERSGIHDPENFRVMDEEAVAILSSLKRGKTMVTLAPEVVSTETIRALAGAGIIVSAGHTNASYEEMRGALAAGVRGFTHLFNAMSPMKTRGPGTVGAALDDRESWCGIIVDGLHVHPAVLRVALRCKGGEKLMLVTDAMPSVGVSKKVFSLQGKTITVKNGVCVGPDGTLAGSDLDMAAGFRNLLSFLNLDLRAASRMASANAAAFLGLEDDTARIAAGARADLVLLNGKLEVRQTWIGGAPQVRVL
jgi:N-acetylglucosamine-6-phosphate deacetylase